MHALATISAGFLVALLLLFTPSASRSQVSVLTQRNDNGRTGQNLNETILNSSNVKVSSFGKLFARPVDGQIYAQPLYVPGLTIQGTLRNVVYVATEHNSVYAFDADDPAASAPLWHVNLGPSVPSNDVCLVTPDPDCPNTDTLLEYGITSTSVIDPAAGAIYLVAKNKDADASYHYRLHALDLVTGAEKFGGPVEVTAQVAGSGTDGSNGVVSFDPVHEGNRPGLLLMNGVIYAAFGSVGEIPTWHGWVLGYDAATLKQVAVLNLTPDGAFAGIWGGGQGLVGDGSHIYFLTGNGTFDANNSGRDYGNSILKLDTAGGLSVADYFTPYNQAELDAVDLDLGSGGPMALPGTGMIVAAGKDGIMRLLNTANLGQYHGSYNNDVQEFPFSTGIFMGGPVYWNSPNNGPVIYAWGPGDYLKAFKFSGGLFDTTPVSKSTMVGMAGYSNAVPLSVSANGSQAGSGIVWAWAPYSGDANHATVAGMLRAFDATDLSQELWNSQQFAARDSAGNYAKFSVPTVANGKVYLATFSGQLLVYGLNPPQVATVPSPWASQDVGSVGATGSADYSGGTFTVDGSGWDIEDNADAFRYVYQPLNGDGEIVARVATQQNTNAWAKAGVMVRETLSAGSPYALMALTPSHGAALQARLVTDGTTYDTAGPAAGAPYWVKLVRSGSTFTGYVSPDGSNWTRVGSQSIAMTGSVYAGLAVTSHDNSVICQATMDGVGVGTAGGTTSPTVAITAPANGASYSAPASVAIGASATPSGGATVSRVDFFAGSSLLGSATSSPFGMTWSGVPAGSYSLTAKVTDSLGQSATSSPVAITVSSPSGSWSSSDIGSVGVAGSTGNSGGTFTIAGSGWDIEDNADAFRYVYLPLTADGEIVARVSSQQNTDSWAKAGVMIRESLAAGSPYVMMAVTPSHGAAFQRRFTTDGATYDTAGPGAAKAPYWVKLVRSGSSFTGFVSADGTSWTQVATDQISMPSTVYVGLAVTSHNNSVSCTVTMDNVAATGTGGGSYTPPTVIIGSPAAGSSYTAPATVAVTATAQAGSGATVSKVDFYAGGTLIGTAPASPYGITWNGVPAGSYTLTATVTDSQGNSATSPPVGITVAPSQGSSLPAPWADSDVGSAAVAGSAGYAAGTFTVAGSGWDIEDNADAFHYLYQPLAGDGELVARVATQQDTNAWAKAGVMVRQDLTAGSPYAMMAITPEHGTAFQRRFTRDGATYDSAGAAVRAPYWVRITRSGNTLTGSISQDGVNWVIVAGDTVAMTGSVYLGLAVTSHDNTVSSTVTMDGVK